MSDLISRQAAIELIESEYRRWGEEYEITDVLCDLGDLPTAEPNAAVLKVEVSAEEAMETVKNTLSDYFDKLWETAYERGKAEAHPKKGKWINHRNDEGHNIADCDQCGEAMQWFDDDIKPNYCPNCGAKMMEDDMR